MFLDTITAMPLPAAPSQAEAAIEQWLARVKAIAETQPDAPARLSALLDTAKGNAFIQGLFGCSTFLATVAAQQPLFSLDLFEQGPDSVWPGIMELLQETTNSDTVAKHLLRTARKRAALAIAVGDVSGLWTVEQVTNALSDIADASIQYALAFALRELQARDRLRLPDLENPANGSGFIILGMGKLGAHELNYSSDIDLIALYDPDIVPTTRPDRLAQDMVRMTQRWVDLLHDRTADGFAFRTDLRLRPDPSSTPPAISIPAAEFYYESTGQNWERAAMIKARLVAGDPQPGKAFLDFLRPFVWRRSLDFWAIQDIHSIKRQINAHRGGAAIAIAGHDIKVGRGGIREIEFFAQTQQLIWGGRNPSLRIRPTCKALDALVNAELVEPATAAELKDCYTYLRRLEHRLQMVADQQTQRLPPAEGLDAIARFMGEDDTATFSAQVRQVLETVERHYAALFEDEAELAVEGLGNLVFTGGDPDTGTLETLAGLGFQTPERIDAAVRRWHHGHLAATRSTRARELLTELMPSLLKALAETADPDEAFGNFDQFLHGLPAGVQLFSLFATHPDLLALVAEICGSAPWLGQHMRRRPAVLDAVLAPGFFAPLPNHTTIASDLTDTLTQARDMQDTLDLARRYASDLNFKVGVHLLRGRASAVDTGPVLSALADNVVSAMLDVTHNAFAERHGNLPGNGVAIIGYGKWGSAQLNPGSDLDMVSLYDSNTVTDNSDGPKPLAASTYATRLTQRLLTALTSETESGRLYEVDMRLRPNGDKGPFAAQMAGFETYLLNDAWTWEHLALVRSRFICGAPPLTERFESIRSKALSRPRKADQLASEVEAMRQRMAGAFKGESIWDVKHRRGGLVDTGFLAQFIVLAHAAVEPALLTPRSTEGIATAAARAGLITSAEAEDLSTAETFWLSLQTLLRLTGADAAPERLGRAAVQAVLAQGLGLPDIAQVEAAAADHAAQTMSLYRKLIAE